MKLAILPQRIMKGFWRIRSRAYTHLVGGWRTFLPLAEAGIGGGKKLHMLLLKGIKIKVP